MSIFNQIYTQGLKTDDFWIEINALNSKINSKPVLYKQNLKFKYKSEALRTIEVKLNSSSLYFFSDEGTISMAKIKWYIIESFFETNETESRYGFSIKTSSKTYDFYTENSFILETWMKHLSSISIMNNFEEDFVIIKPVDSGKFGTVYLCQETRSLIHFALKKISKENLKNIKALSLLYNEITILRKINHPFVIKLFSVFEDEESISLLLEYVPYGNLYQRMTLRGKLQEREVMMFARNLFEVISLLHAKGIVHRDLKLENILMTSKFIDYEFKIADFGLACYIEKLKRTRSGSPGYMAPEILLGNAYSSKVDIFSAGVIIYILLTGVSPFRANNISQIIEKNTRCQIAFDGPEFKNISPVAIGFLMDSLNSEPSYRITAEQALRNLWLRFRKSSDSDATCTTIKNDFTREIYSFSKTIEKMIDN